MRWRGGRSPDAPAVPRPVAPSPTGLLETEDLGADNVEIVYPLTGDLVVDLFHYSLAAMTNRQATALHSYPCFDDDLTRVQEANGAARDVTTRAPEVGTQVRIALGIMRDMGMGDWMVKRWVEYAALALAARPLIGTAGWDQLAYDSLSRPWRQMIAPLHPDDGPLPEDVQSDDDTEPPAASEVLVGAGETSRRLLL